MSAEIPNNVYYINEVDNFFSEETRKGMGEAFYLKWRSRKFEFKQRSLSRSPEDNPRRWPANGKGD